MSGRVVGGRKLASLVTQLDRRAPLIRYATMSFERGLNWRSDAAVIESSSARMPLINGQGEEQDTNGANSAGHEERDRG
jgi:hypothetical protein